MTNTKAAQQHLNKLIAMHDIRVETVQDGATTIARVHLTVDGGRYTVEATDGNPHEALAALWLALDAAREAVNQASDRARTAQYPKQTT